jgi:quinol monooxygenase YgiN
MSTTPYGFVARIEAKPDKSQQLSDLLTGALPLAEAESGTVRWHAAQTSPTTFWVFDTFATEDARQAHISGPIAQALMSNVDELMAGPPEILPADVLATK